MSRGEPTRGYAVVDLVVALAIFALVTVGVHQVFVPFLRMAQSMNERLAVQQDTRLAMERMSRDFRETTMARVRIYGGGRAVGLVSARPDCGGAFTVDVTSGRPLWQAMIYIVHDAISGEIRAYCDGASLFPAAVPETTGAYRVLAANVEAMAFTLNLDSVTVELHEQTPRGDADRYIRTEFVPRNR